MAWSEIFTSNGYQQYFRFTGDPSIVFDRETHRAGFGNAHADCPLQSVASFDRSVAELKVRYDYNSLSNNENCTGALNPMEIGLTVDANSVFETYFDSQSLVVATAVNAGLLDVRTLSRLMWTSDGDFVRNNITYSDGVFYDSRFPGMFPIFCVYSNPARDDAVSDFCLVIWNELAYGFPLFTEFGANGTFPQPCSCTDDTGTSAACNEFNLLTGFLFFNLPFDDSTAYLLDLVFASTSNQAIVANAHNAMVASILSSSFGDSSQFINETFRSEAYDWCNVSGVGCSIFAYNMKDPYTQINNYYLQIFEASCSDTLYYAGAMTKLGNIAPVPLEEKYFECTSTVWNALINSIGVATGTASLFLPMFILMFVWIANYMKSSSKKAELRRYTQDDRDGIIDALALQLLLVRDKSMHRMNRSKTSVLADIISEAQDNITEGDGYIDMVALENGLYDMRSAFGLPAYVGPNRDGVERCILGAERKKEDQQVTASSAKSTKVAPFEEPPGWVDGLNNNNDNVPVQFNERNEGSTSST